MPGLKLSEHSEFEAAAIGDEAAGQRVKITAPGVATGYETDIVFRRGRIVAWWQSSARTGATRARKP